jgi:hypothetical protein
MKGEFKMSNKLTVTKKKMAALGLKQTERGDYDYINPEEKNNSKYKPIKKESR